MGVVFKSDILEYSVSGWFPLSCYLNRIFQGLQN